MRIISGKFKGKKFQFIKSDLTRPLKDSVKENIFNIIDHSNIINIKLVDSFVLDLYSGIGSFGLECISRGAKQVTFVEESRLAIKILNSNLKSLSINNKAEVFNKKVENILKIKSSKKYNFFFLDPPFANTDFINNLKLLKEKKIFSKNHLIIIHRENESKDNFEKYLNIKIIKKYGRSEIFFGTFE